MRPVLVHIGGYGVPTHDFFVALGILVGALVFYREAHHRGALRFETLVAVTGALVGGAIGMRLSGLLPLLDPAANPTLIEAWEFGARSIFGGLTGAYTGVLGAKKLIGYRVRTGDLFAPAVALGMAVGRIGCLLTEAPHLAAFAALRWLRPRVQRPGELFTMYLAGYAVFRFAVEFTRANETVWLDLTRPQWFLIPGIALLGWRVAVHARAGVYDDVLRRGPTRQGAAA